MHGVMLTIMVAEEHNVAVYLFKAVAVTLRMKRFLDQLAALEL